MKGLFRRIHQDNGGFTLIELLIVIAILGVLAAVALPNFSGIIGRGEEQAAKAELVTVQTAMDTMMAVHHLGDGDVDAVLQADCMSDMSLFPSADQKLYPGYMRSGNTTGTYYCDDTGLVSQNSTGYE